MIYHTTVSIEIDDTVEVVPLTVHYDYNPAEHGTTESILITSVTSPETGEDFSDFIEWDNLAEEIFDALSEYDGAEE